MPVDVGDENIRIRVREPGSFVEGTFKTITLSEDQGIKAVIGKLKGDPGGSTVIQSYIFDRNQWSSSEAESWVKSHKQQKSAGAYERRYTSESDIQLRVEGRDKTIVGYAAVFNTEAEIAPGFMEEVAPGAFARALMEDDVRALWNHNADYVLGRTKSGTLRLSEDVRGLRYEVIPPDTAWARDLITLIKRGDINQSSFGFNVTKQDRKTEDNGRRMRRIIQSVKLYDVSPVTFPAYSETEVHVRRIGSEKDCFWLDEESEEVIAIPEVVPAGPEITTKELLQRIEDMKRKVLG